MNTIQRRIFDQVDMAPEAPALAFADARGRCRWSSRREVYERALTQAHRLREGGLLRGSVCILVLPSDELCASSLLACLQLGAIPLLVAPPFLQGPSSALLKTLRYCVKQVAPRVVLCDESMTGAREELGELGEGTTFLFGGCEDLSGPLDEGQLQWPRPVDVAALQLTSGTTGYPRICTWKQEGVLAALDAMRDAMALGSEDVCFNWTPLYHDMGLVNNFFLCMTAGVPLVLMSPHTFVRRPASWLRGLAESGATLTWSPNFGFALAAQRIRDAELEGVHLGAVRGFWNAAERIHLETMQAFYRRFSSIGVRYSALQTNFGCAENVGGATFSDPEVGLVYEVVDRSRLYEEGTAVPVDDRRDLSETVSIVSVGCAAPGLAVTILGPGGEPLADGQVGELALRTPSCMAGYLGDTEATREALRGELLVPGDLAYLRGREVFWVGRSKERIAVHGKKFDPSDFESVLFGMAQLRPGCFGAFGVDDPECGTQRLVVVAEPRTEDCDRDAITEQIVTRIGLELGVKVDDVVLVPRGTLVKTSSGKRRHRHIRQLYMTGELGSALSIPAGTTESRGAP